MYLNLADSCLQLGLHSTGMTAIANSMEIERELLRLDPPHVETRWMMAERLRLKGEFLFKEGNLAKSSEVLREAVGYYRPSYLTDSKNYRSLRGLISGLTSLLPVVATTGPCAEAASLAQELIELGKQSVARNPSLVAARVDLQLAKSMHGKLKQTGMPPCAISTR